MCASSWSHGEVSALQMKKGQTKTEGDEEGYMSE
jgi:hypothetical protein